MYDRMDVDVCLHEETNEILFLVICLLKLCWHSGLLPIYVLIHCLTFLLCLFCLWHSNSY
jgi:hypothetical protein